MGIARLMAPAVVSAFIVSVLCSACVRQDRGGSRYGGPPEGEYVGDSELLIANKTQTPITKVHIADSFTGYPKVVYFDRKYGKLDAIMPGTAQALHVKPAKYWISVENINYQRVVEKKEVPVNGKTNLVIYAGEPPEPMPGYETVSVAAVDRGGPPPPPGPGPGGPPPMAGRDREREQRDRNLRANKAECTRDIPPANLAAQPGRMKLGGSWRCVMSGDLSGFDAIDIAQLPDGRIDAFVTAGYDRNQPLKGAIVGDELHFYFPKFAAAGGRMKIESSMRSMSGDGASFQDDGRCTHWRFSCTKQ
jgi:hypothetical protein